VFGGKTPPTTGATELFNGTNWTEVNDLNTARTILGGTGIATSSLAFGGNPVPNAPGATELWNGTNWTNQNSFNTGRDGLSGSGTATLALAFGGYTTTSSAATEEWYGDGLLTLNVTTS
jgi:hypothetical protein